MQNEELSELLEEACNPLLTIQIFCLGLVCDSSHENIKIRKLPSYKSFSTLKLLKQFKPKKSQVSSLSGSLKGLEVITGKKKKKIAWL